MNEEQVRLMQLIDAETGSIVEQFFEENADAHPQALLAASFRIFVDMVEGSMNIEKARPSLIMTLEELAKKAMGWQVQLDSERSAHGIDP